jgi:hypothetical protein
MSDLGLGEVMLFAEGDESLEEGGVVLDEGVGAPGDDVHIFQRHRK